MGVDPMLRNCVGSRSYELKYNLNKTTEAELICYPLEGSGTRPDYLVNRDDQKNERPFGEQNCTKFEKQL